MKDRFALDREQNILFINFADFRIESQAQVDEMARLVQEAVAGASSSASKTITPTSASNSATPEAAF